MGLLLRQGWYTVNVYRSDPINSIGKSFGILYIGNLTTIPVEPGFLWDFVFLSLKTCSLYHEKLFIQKVQVISSQVLNNFFSASDIMEAVRGLFRFYGMNAI